MLNRNFKLYAFGALISLLFLVIVGLSAPHPVKMVFVLVGGLNTYRYAAGAMREKELIDAIRGKVTYRVTYDDLPVDRLLIGKGFMWTPAHSKKVNLLMQDKEMLEQGAALGGLSFIHGIGISEERDIHVPLDDLVGHMIVMGTTRVGKTRGYEIAVVQPVKRGETVVIFDPKGDAGLLNRTVEACRRYGREKDFIFFALPYPRLSAYYNPLKNFTLPNEIPDRIAMLLPSGGSSDSFRAFSWQVISAINNALLFLGERPTIRSLYDYSLNKMDSLCCKCIEKAFNNKGILSVLEDFMEERNIDSVSKRIELYVALYKKHHEVQNGMIDDLVSLASHPREHFQKMIASLTPTLAKLATGEIGHILSETPRDGVGIDWEIVAKKKKVVYMFFGSLLLGDTARYVIRMAMQDFRSYVGARYSYEPNMEPINLFIDEFTEVVDSSSANLINKCGGAQVRVTLASQSEADIEAELGSSAKAQQIFDNLNTKLWMRNSDISTAQVFSNAAGTITVQQEGSGFSVSPDMSDNDIVFRSSYSRSVSEKAVPLIDPSWMLKLPKGQGFLISSGRVYKVRIPLLQDCKVNYLEELGIHDTKVFE
ncbi:MAG: conjugative transfer system coupling protein TraD [Nitrospirae bacterium]|nr:conjugative transfer system coupling protein TraD [Nitrospirota bacterium]